MAARLYAIKLPDGYFKEYVYADKNYSDRYTGPMGGTTRIMPGDIIGYIVTANPERLETKLSLGNTIRELYWIDSLEDKKIEIIPVKGE